MRYQAIFKADTSSERASEILASLTEKQVAVLDLLIEHKTSKEIALELSISPHTVDQRISFAKAKLDVASRGELAKRYSDLLRMCQRTIYEESHLTFPSVPLDVDETNLAGIDLCCHGQVPSGSACSCDANIEFDEVHEASGVTTGVAKSVGLVVAIMVGLSLSIAGGLAIFIQLSILFAT